MAEFDLDDPLGDLLSEGSTDSFFDTKPKKTVKTIERKSVNDLFDFGKKTEEKVEIKKPDQKKNDDWLGLSEISKPTPPKERSSPIKAPLKPVKKISFEDEDDVEKKRTGEGKKINLIEGILGTPSKIEEKEKTVMSKPQENYGFSSLEGPREGRRSKPQSNTSLIDPLGLLSNEPKKEDLKKPETPSTEILFPVPKQRELKTKSAPNIGELPNWLGGDSSVKTHKSETIVQTNQKQEEIQPTRPDSRQTSRLSTPAYLDIEQSNQFLTQQKLANTQIEYQNAALTMQQQDAQILMALQVKKYDETLVELQRKQQDVLAKQEQQFNSLLERQIAKQQLMENNLRLQQDKINSHIQMLISQPIVMTEPGNLNLNEKSKSDDNEKNKVFEELLNSMKQRNHEETFLLEESYKKQIATVEQAMESMEKRLRTEIDSISEAHKQKYEQIKTDYEKEIDRYKTKFEDLNEQHKAEIKEIRENHNRIIEEIKYEYSTMVENIKQTKQSETTLFQNTNEYATKLNENLKMLDVSTKLLIGVREKVDGDYNVLSQAREESLKAKEEEIRLMRLTLEKSRESADLERAQLLALVRTLETKIAEQSHNEREDRWALQQATAIFSAKSKALEREAEYNKTCLEREREEFKTLKETLLADQEKLLLQITDERLALAAERKRVETQQKLAQSFDSQRAKAELEAAICVAKEAAEMTDREREELYKRQADVEMLKRSLIDREKKLKAREKDLEVKSQMAARKEIDGEKAVEEAKNLERNCNNRMKEVQVQLSSLAMREKKLADEKVALSRERFALHNQKIQVKKCGLCEAVTTGVPRGRMDEENSEVEQDFPQFSTISDPDLLRLRYQFSEDVQTDFNKDLNSA